MNQIVLDAVALVTVCVITYVLLRPAVAKFPAWRATITPLASIIGSGFLVVGPLLSDIAGVWAPLAMAALCGLAWLFGSTVRYNIAHVEALHAKPSAARDVVGFDRLADLCLAFAYFVSVTYYLNLLGAYLLKGVGLVDTSIARIVTSAVVIGLALVGLFRGFRGLERIEVGAVSFKLAVIAAALLVLMLSLFNEPASGWQLPTAMPESAWHTLRILLGCVILVQGFETSRYLGKDYPAALRIRSMRWAQWLSTAIYVCFIALLLPHAPGGKPGAGAETQIVDVLGRVAQLLGPMLVLAALASQLSAAVADMSGAGGLIGDYGAGRFNPRWAYLGIGLVALLLTWTTDIFGLIAYASRAFAFYYALQCALAWRVARGRLYLRIWFGAGCLVAAAVVIFGVAAAA